MRTTKVQPVSFKVDDASVRVGQLFPDAGIRHLLRDVQHRAIVDAVYGDVDHLSVLQGYIDSPARDLENVLVGNDAAIT